jgi:hypothetical protein
MVRTIASLVCSTSIKMPYAYTLCRMTRVLKHNSLLHEAKLYFKKSSKGFGPGANDIP